MSDSIYSEGETAACPDNDCPGTATYDESAGWECDECGTQWEDDEIEDATSRAIFGDKEN